MSSSYAWTFICTRLSQWFLFWLFWLVQGQLKPLPDFLKSSDWIFLGLFCKSSNIFFFFNLKPPVDLNNVTLKLKKKLPYILHVIILKKQIDFQHDDRNKMTIIFQWNYTLRSSNLVLAAVEGNRKTFWLKFHLFASPAANANEMMLLQSTSAWWLDKILSGPRLESHFQKHYYSK